MRQLGDGFYEQQLVQCQIQQITGQRYLVGYSSNEAQYQALMNAGLQVAQAQRYMVGVAHTDAQGGCTEDRHCLAGQVGGDAGRR
ncbi:hypothetical protein [Herbaspirillum huttiense]|uniref:Uncharacterized protein n=2 Tax=Herbaspirillum huttiense TaxID=863372 RepID=A0AAJ2LT81_9BURK|nr:hypothetical protein [Herbaspirillum huttiense]MDR9838667.1 hypothetical protein [Herbaspirillum huttiense]